MHRVIADRDAEQPWQWMRLHRGTAVDPRLILVRAMCACGWIVSGDPVYALGAASEHFRSHWDVQGALHAMTLSEDLEGEADMADSQREESGRQQGRRIG